MIRVFILTCQQDCSISGFRNSRICADVTNLQLPLYFPSDLFRIAHQIFKPAYVEQQAVFQSFYIGRKFLCNRQ